MALSNAGRQAQWRERQKKQKAQYERALGNKQGGIDPGEVQMLLKEIKRRHAAAKAQREKSLEYEGIAKLDLIDMVNWIEDELGRILASASVT